MNAKKSPSRSGARQTNTLRIIGGRWRGRRLSFPPEAGLRPTGDRIRETLFNWLGPRLPGSRCLDLFAGSGALGLEALSRGAASAVLIDHSGTVCRRLVEHGRTLSATGLAVIEADALLWLKTDRPPQPVTFDLAFVDPPFGGELLDTALESLDVSDRLAADALVYVEYALGQQPRHPAGWRVHRSGRAGRVCYELLATA